MWIKEGEPSSFRLGTKCYEAHSSDFQKFSVKSVQRTLVPKFKGPFKVIRRVGNAAYRLAVPDIIKVYPTYHVSLLKPFYEDFWSPIQR